MNQRRRSAMTSGPYGRRDRLIKEKRHDVYQEECKLPDPTVCSECNALFVEGRWSWKETKKTAKKVVCPACKRIADNFPAGYVTMKGAFFLEKRKEILSLVRNVEKQEKSEHPLERIIAITDEKDHVLISTTGTHLARRIGEALSRSYKGDYSCKYSDGEEIVRVSWQR
jgi:NMD protein affecting ribosome stability and mRNA decay